MPIARSLIASWLALAFIGSATAAERHPFSVEDLVRLKRVSDPALSPDGKTVGVFDSGKLSWFDATTGKPERPDPAPVMVRTAGRSATGGNYSPDRRVRLQVWERQPTIIFQKPSKTEHGVFVRITDTATDKSWNWRVGAGDKRGFAFSTRCIVVIVRATTRPGSTLRRFRRQRGSTRLSNTARGAAKLGTNLNRKQARLSPRSIGVPADLPIPIWI